MQHNFRKSTLPLWGINCFNHDTSLCVVKNEEVIFHKSIKSSYLNEKLVNEALEYGMPEAVCFYEYPWLKNIRQLYSFDWIRMIRTPTISQHLKKFNIQVPIHYCSHHASHAAAAYYTGPFEECVILVADAIGEIETLTIWSASNKGLIKLNSKWYPYSLGIFYSAFTLLAGFNKFEEGKLMQLAKEDCDYMVYSKIKNYLFKNNHRGINDWNLKVDREIIASATQKVFEDELINQISLFQHKNLIFTGGCAFNKKAVKKMKKIFENVYVPNNPGDAFSSIGAVANFLKTKLHYGVINV